MARTASTPACGETPLASLRLAGVSYLNAMPVLYGLRRRSEAPMLRVDVPAALAEALGGGALDLALAPVATLARAPRLEVAPGICIGCDGPVQSVLIIADRPLEDLDTLLLDAHSQTSVVLAQLVAGHLRRGRGFSVEAATHRDMPARVGGGTGAVVIGDAALALRERYQHVLDLGQAWQDWTGLPFVFAAWVARPGVVGGRVQALLDESLAEGLAARPEIARSWAAEHGGSEEEHLGYLTDSIRYVLDERFEAGLKEFLERAGAAGLLPDIALRFCGRAA